MDPVDPSRAIVFNKPILALLNYDPEPLKCSCYDTKMTEDKKIDRELGFNTRALQERAREGGLRSTA